MPDINTHTEVTLEQTLRADVVATASGVLHGDRFRGPFSLQCSYFVEEEAGVFVEAFELHADGTFEFVLR